MSKYNYEYCGFTRWDWMQSLIRAIRNTSHRDDTPEEHRRDWHVREQAKYDMHPIIKKAVMLAPPLDWHNLVLEWPHVSVSNDTSKIAYTRNEQHGIDNRQTATSVGKYITRHFPTLKDHQVRDLCGMYGASVFKITYDPEVMIGYIQKGPKSCMVFDEDDDDHMADEGHPYRVYDPALGWGLAVRMMGGSIDGRALVNENSKTFVRSYRRNDGGYSSSDEDLNSWLNDQGYRHKRGWDEGTRLRYIPFRKYGQDLPTAPYIDGENRIVRVDEYTKTLIIDDGGEWLCDLTNGEAQEYNACRCPDCNERVDEDDLTSTYDGNGDSVCNSCLENDYYYVHGRRGYQYYVHRNDMVETIEGDYFHDDYLSDNNIVELADGEYTHQDNAVCIGDAWYCADDEDIVYCDDTEDYALRDDVWQCFVSEKWYASDDPVRLCCIDSQDELTVHKDEIDKYEADIDTPIVWTPYPVYQPIEGE
jgi:hypothetical protein